MTRADFLIFIFTAIFSAIGGAVSAISFGQVLLGVLINVGMTLLQMLFVKSPKPEDMQTVYRQSTPVRVHRAGRDRAGGPLLMIEVKNRRIYMVIYFAEGEVDAYEEWFVDSRPVLIENNWLVSEPYRAGDVALRWRTGRPRETAYAPLISNLSPFVDQDFRGDGLATACLIGQTVSQKRLGKVYPNRIPTVNCVARFAKPFDPRTGQHAWSSNLPILLRHYLTHPDGAGIAASDIADEDFIAAANVADEFLPTKNGGTVRRYHGSITWKLDEKVGDVIRRICMHMDGRLFLRRDGRIGFHAGVWRQPRVHIADRQIVNANIRGGTGIGRGASVVIVKYANPATSYLAASAAPWINAEAAARGETQARTMVVELYGIQHHNHARRIAKILDAKANAAFSGTITTGLDGMELWDETTFTFDYADFDLVRCEAEITDIGFDESRLEVTVQFQSLGAAAYAFDPATEEGTAPVDPESIDPGVPPVPRNFRVTGSSRVVGGRRVAVLSLEIDRPRDDEGQPVDNVDIEFQFAAANSERWIAIGGPGEELSTEVSGLEDGALYDCRVRLRGATGEASEWVIVEDVLATADPVAPGVPLAASVAIVGPRTARVAWTNPNSPNFAATRVWRGRTADGSGATAIGTVYGAPNGADRFDDETAPAGATSHYFVAALNDSGVASARVHAGAAFF